MDYIAKNKNDMSATYLELVVPVVDDKETQWSEKLDKYKNNFNVEPQKFRSDKEGRLYYHITVAYMEKFPLTSKVISVVDRIAKKYTGQIINFDKVDAFLTKKKDQYIIHLGATHVPDEFYKMVEDFRNGLVEAGAVLSKDEFKFHATLGRVYLKKNNVGLEELRNSLSQWQVNQPIGLTMLKYRKGGSREDAPSIAVFKLGLGVM